MERVTCPLKALYAAPVFNLPPLPRKLSAARRDLLHAKPAVRVDAARDLGRSAGAGTSIAPDRAERVSALVASLADGHAGVRKQAVLSLADIEATEAVDAIFPLLGDVDLSVRQMAVVALGELADPTRDDVVGRLVGLLEAGAPAIRYQALIAHCRLRPAEAAADIERAARDADPEIRELALRLIDEVLIEDQRDPASISKVLPVIERARKDEHPRVRLLSELLAAEYGQAGPYPMLDRVVARQMRTREPRDEQWAIELAGRLQMRQLEGPLRTRAFGLLGISWDPFRWLARAALARLGDARALDTLEKALSSSSWLRRTHATHAIGLARLSALRPRLVRMLGHGELVDQEVLGEALSVLNGPAA